MSGAQVRLNVYDMYWLNEYASNIGFGIFHSGIEVFGVEYAFGGHPYQFSGVFESSPQDAEELGENFKFKESIVLGYTDFTREDIRDLIKSVGSQFRGDRYHLINRNCNHFSAELAKLLTGKEIPTWVNRLANISGSIPFLEKCLPQEWLTPVALQESLNHPSPKPATRDAARNASSARDASTATRITWRRKSSIDEAEEATESIGRRLNALNGRQDSRTTVLSGVAGDMTSSSSASSTSSEDGGRGSPPSTYSRLWNQIKSSVGANETLRN